MRIWIQTLAFSLLTALNVCAAESIYDFTVKDIDGKEVKMETFKDKVLLIVNVASECGDTPQYETLQLLHETVEEHGFAVLGFPANNYGGQEPGTDQEIKTFCSTNYQVTFPMFSKVSVNGDDQIELFKFLTEAENPDFDGPIQWNFEKILVGKDGKVARRFRNYVTPDDNAVLEAIAAELKKGDEAAAEGFKATEADAAITLSFDGADFLTYHKAEVTPPPGVDPIYKRSGFIHPLKTPSGAEVTGIHPADHYHHLGFWHAWVKTKHGDDEHDFWNLKTQTGRVGYSKTIAVTSTSDEAGFVVEQLHIGYKGEDKTATTILREEFTVKARMVDGAFEVDYETKQTNVTETTLQLPAYRYGGPIAYRAPHHWKTANSDYLSSEGKTRIDGHTTRSRWVAMFGPATDAEDAPIAAVTILGHSENHDAPQRMRVWPPNTHDGAIFLNYVPIQETEWALEPGKTSTMRYRLVVQDNKPDSEALDARWNRYTK